MDNLIGLKISKRSLSMIEERFSDMYRKAKNPCTPSREVEMLFDKIEFGRIILSHVGMYVCPPNNRGAVHIEVSEGNGSCFF